MPNSYTGSPNFYYDINAADATEDDLTTLKGAAPDSADSIYASEGYKLTTGNAAALAFKLIYLGDNYAGNASTKVGLWDVPVGKAGQTITIYDTATQGGITGEGATSNLTITGTAASPITIVGNTVNKCSDVGTAAGLCNYQNVVFNKVAPICGGNAARQFTNVTVKGANVATLLYFTVMPAVFESCGIDTAGAAGSRIYIAFNATTAQLNYLCLNMKEYSVAAGNSLGHHIVKLAGNMWKRFKISNAPMIDQSRHFPWGKF